MSVSPWRKARRLQLSDRPAPDVYKRQGEMRFQPEGTDNWEYAVVGMGFVEIVNNRVTLLVETAERPEEIDVARAREAKERAEEQMRQKPVSYTHLDVYKRQSLRTR